MLVNPTVLVKSGRERIGKGMFITELNSDIELWGDNGPYHQNFFSVEDLNSYGVVDTPEQFQKKFGDLIEKDARPIVVCFYHISKDPSNKHKGGGWRWHKWGEYLGDGDPSCEYLDDEDGFDNGVYVYHMHDVTGLSFE